MKTLFSCARAIVTVLYLTTLAANVIAQPPLDIKQIGAYDTPGSAYGLELTGTYAYVADCGSGLQIIDISNPTSPTLVGSYDTPTCAFDVVVAGNHAYVADGSTLQLIDISNPDSMTLAGSYNVQSPVGFAVSVAVAGNYAYLGEEASLTLTR